MRNKEKPKKYIKTYGNFDVYCRTYIEKILPEKKGFVYVNKKTGKYSGHILELKKLFYDENNNRLDTPIIESEDNYYLESVEDYEYRQI